MDAFWRRLNDCAIAIETLRSEYGIRRIGYVDIDAHHTDGVFYAFEEDPDLVFVDLHEDGRYLYPGSGFSDETGRGAAHGSKLNIPVSPQAGDETFFKLWESAERFVAKARPEFLLLQCGADSLAALADHFCQGRLLALGGGGYDRANLAAAWTAVVEALLGESA